MMKRGVVLFLFAIVMIIVLTLNVKAVCQPRCLPFSQGCTYIGCVADNCYNVCVPTENGCLVTQLIDCNQRHAYCSTSIPPCGGACLGGWKNCNGGGDGCECPPEKACQNGACVGGPSTMSCNSCLDCQTKLNNAPPHSVIFLEENISISDSFCLNFFSRHNTLTFDCKGNFIIWAGGSPTGTGIMTRNVSNVTIKNCGFTNLNEGIHICYNSSRLIIDNVTAINNTIGITFCQENKNITIKNSKLNNNYNGIEFSIGPHYNTTLENNTICYNQIKDINVSGQYPQNATYINNFCNQSKTDIQACEYSCVAPPECNITSTNITAACSPNCDVGDTVNVQANFEGQCNSVSTLKVKVSNVSGENSFNITIPCDLSQGQLACSGNFELPICYDDQIFIIKNSSAYNANNVLVAYNDTIPHIYGDFQFTSQCSQLISIDEKPDFIGMIMGQSVSLTVNAIFMKAGNIFYKDITLSPHTNYWSNNTYVINVIRTSAEVKANALAPGIAYVKAEYPFGFAGSKTDNSYFVVGPNVGCTINSASIDLTNCGTDGCNVSEKINMTLRTTGCASYLMEGGNITMRADNGGSCSVNMTGSFNQACIVCNATWTITEANVDWANCGGKTVTVKHAELWSTTQNTVIGAKQGNFGSFQFWKEMPPEPAYITLWPMNWTIQQGDNVSYEVWAYYNNGNSENVSLADETSYNSSNKTVAYHQTNEPKNKFYGNSVGITTITARYPDGYDYVKENSTFLYVYPYTGCNILNANITPYCNKLGNNYICDNGDNIDLGVFVSQECRDLNIEKIQMKAHEEFGEGQGQNSFCVFDMNTTFTIGNCEQQEGVWFCHGTWQVDVPNGCEGKTVIVDSVIVYNYVNNFLDSRQGYIGNFSFVSSSSDLRAIIVEPEDNTVFNLSEYPPPLANFTQASIGEITLWSWYYRKIAYPSSQWILLRSTSNPSEANITDYSFVYHEWKGGNYDINLTVSNESLKDDDIVKITLIDDNTPIANITKPLDNDIVYNNSVLFNSSCFDPNNDPLNVTWYFDDGTNVTGPYTQYNEITHIFEEAKPDFFEVYLNVTDGENSSVDYVQFKIAYCSVNNNYYFAGSCIGNNNLYCNKSDCNVFGECNVVADCSVCNNCGMIGKICDFATGNCTDGPTSEECQNCMQQQQPCDPDECNSIEGCYWDDCRACFINGVRQVNSCSDYKEESCNADPCHVGNQGGGGLGTEICGQTITQNGEVYFVTNCHCEWNADADNCTLAYTLVNQDDPPGNSEDCSYIINSQECGSCLIDGREGRNISYELVEGNEHCFESRTICQPCGLLFRPLPFFSWWQILCVIALVIIIYAFMFRNSKF